MTSPAASLSVAGPADAAGRRTRRAGGRAAGLTRRSGRRRADAAGQQETSQVDFDRQSGEQLGPGQDCPTGLSARPAQRVGHERGRGDGIRAELDDVIPSTSPATRRTRA